MFFKNGPEYKMDENERMPIRWLSPETMQNFKFDFASEVWSFGIVCYEIFSNAEEPYSGYSLGQVNMLVRSILILLYFYVVYILGAQSSANGHA